VDVPPPHLLVFAIGRSKQDGRSKPSDRVGTENRPKAVGGRRCAGDWDVDTVEGSKGTGLLVTLIERKNRVVRIAKAANSGRTRRATARRCTLFLTRHQLKSQAVG